MLLCNLTAFFTLIHYNYSNKHEACFSCKITRNAGSNLYIDRSAIEHGLLSLAFVSFYWTPTGVTMRLNWLRFDTNTTRVNRCTHAKLVTTLLSTNYLVVLPCVKKSVSEMPGLFYSLPLIIFTHFCTFTLINPQYKSSYLVICIILIRENQTMLAPNG